MHVVIIDDNACTHTCSAPGRILNRGWGRGGRGPRSSRDCCNVIVWNGSENSNRNSIGTAECIVCLERKHGGRHFSSRNIFQNIMMFFDGRKRLRYKDVRKKRFYYKLTARGTWRRNWSCSTMYGYSTWIWTFYSIPCHKPYIIVTARGKTCLKQIFGPRTRYAVSGIHRLFVCHSVYSCSYSDQKQQIQMFELSGQINIIYYIGKDLKCNSSYYIRIDDARRCILITYVSR